MVLASAAWQRGSATLKLYQEDLQKSALLSLLLLSILVMLRRCRFSCRRHKTDHHWTLGSQGVHTVNADRADGRACCIGVIFRRSKETKDDSQQSEPQPSQG